MTWHVDAPLLTQYRSEQLSDAAMASVELHVTACEACRALVARDLDVATDSARARVKLALDERLDSPGVGWLGRTLRRAGMSDGDAGLLTAALSLQGSWVVALALALAFATLAASAGSERAALALFLLVAPMVPLAGVVLAYGPRVDPTYEITLAAAVPATRIILLRTIAVLGPAVPIMVGLSLILPSGWLAFGWLLPALALAATSLALGTVVPLHRAAIGLGAAWAMAAGTAFAAAPRTGGESIVRSFALYRPWGQVLLAVLAALSLAVVALRRTEFEIAR